MSRIENWEVTTSVFSNHSYILRLVTLNFELGGMALHLFTCAFYSTVIENVNARA